MDMQKRFPFCHSAAAGRPFISKRAFGSMLSPFAFYFSPFTAKKTLRVLLSAFTLKRAFCFKLFALIFLLSALSLSACKFNPPMQTPGEGYLQGEWQQDSVTGQQQLLSYSLYRLKFSCDSFYLTISTFSKVNTGADTCMNKGHWTEYCKGTYDQKQDTLHLKGQFCNADFTLKNDKGCFRFGDYEEFFKVRKKSGSAVQFVPTTGVIPIDAHLVKRTSCHPKPI
jgi:hypothetical protein